MSVVIQSMIRYATLDKMLDDWARNLFVGNKARIILDINTLLRRIHVSKRRAGVNDIDEVLPTATEIGSDIINLIGHYRSYFNHLKKRSTVYIVGNTNLGTEYTEPLNEYYYNKLNEFCTDDWFKDVAMKGVNIAKYFLQYVPETYFIECDTFSVPTVVQYLLFEEFKQQDPKLILSSDHNLYHLAHHAKILDIRGESTVEITPANACEQVGRQVKVKPDFDVQWLTAMLSVCGNQQLGIKGVPGIGPGTTIKRFNSAVRNIREHAGDYVKPNGTALGIAEYQKDGYRAILEDIFTGLELNTIESNYALLDIFGTYMQADTFERSVFVKKCLTTKVVTKDSVIQAANMFDASPINLDKVFAGEASWFSVPSSYKGAPE